MVVTSNSVFTNFNFLVRRLVAISVVTVSNNKIYLGPHHSSKCFSQNSTCVSHFIGFS